MAKANERQEGGNHYRQPGLNPQHWDLAIMYGWDPFQYQITKYLMRWKDKYPVSEKRLEDLKKGLHFYEKYLENWRAYEHLPPDVVTVLPRNQADMDVEYERQEAASHFFEPDGFTIEGTRYQCIKCRAVVMARSPLGAIGLHPNCSRQEPLAAGRLPTPSPHLSNGS